MKRRIWCVLVLWPAASASAVDRWEDSLDGGPNSRAAIAPGQRQAERDLQGTPANTDQDWVAFAEVSRHSYEARTTGGPGWAAPPVLGGAQLDRVTSTGVVLTAGTGDGAQLTKGNTVRWIAAPAPTQQDFLRIMGEGTTNQGPQPYVLELFDTTYAVPRWNNSGSQVTVFVIQNNTASAVTGSIFFYRANGTLVHTQPLVLPPDGLQVFNTAGIGALAGESGAARIAHLGGVGALSGKAVALEPATGFTFDTAIVPVPQ
ncbi:MAG: hypothetical protein ABW221_24420 [Vicinamibacteria bacterium]